MTGVRCGDAAGQRIRARRRFSISPGQKTNVETLLIIVFVHLIERARLAYHEKAASATGNAPARSPG
ncbi:MAG: hypothetical protein WAO08_17410 [Hyphomicrobiaceae bacterium]|jgi:hypothetical protein|nr:MAG: hypothetical protein EHM67_02870 [Hyphomicrobiaceae bacterium]